MLIFGTALLVLTLEVNPHFSYLSSPLLTSNLTCLLRLPVGRSRIERNVTIKQVFMKLENYVQNCLLFTFLYCEILPLQVKAGAMRR